MDTLKYRDHLTWPHALLNTSTLLCDAHLLLMKTGYHLVLDYTCDRRRTALDVLLISKEYLTPVWYEPRDYVEQYWTSINDHFMRRVHKTVLLAATNAALLPSIERVSLLCHYIRVLDEPALTVQNNWEPGNYRGRILGARNKPKLKDIL